MSNHSTSSGESLAGGSRSPAAPSDLSPVKKPKKAPLRERSPILAHLRSTLLTGLLTAIPIFITLTILYFLYNQVTRFTRGPADWIVDRFLAPMLAHAISIENLKTITTPVVAIFISLFIVYALGLLGTFFIGRQILAQVEHFIENLPLIKGIYSTTKQVIAVFRQGGGGSGFQRVVLVQFPRMGTWTVAFVTNTVEDAMSPTTLGTPGEATAVQRLVCCFIPMTPNPTSGFFQMFPENEVRNTDWSVDMGIKIVLSGGLLAPHILLSSAPAAAGGAKPG